MTARSLSARYIHNGAFILALEVAVWGWRTVDEVALNVLAMAWSDCHRIMVFS